MRIKYILILSMSMLINGCSHHDEYHGYSFDDKEIIKVNTSEEEVLNTMGTPTITSNFGDKTFYYLFFKQISNSFSHPKTVEQKVIEISFNKQNFVQEVKSYGLNDANDIDYFEYATKLKGNERSTVTQVINNIGKFNSVNKLNKKLD